jgi:hypothetical protein
MTSSSSISNKIYFPINQADRAAHSNAASLLATGVFGALQAFIGERVNNVPAFGTAFNDRRQHGGVLIDGPRGSGKSSVLVNLRKYLQDNNCSLIKDIHILDPIDPTLLEDHDDLFLNVVVAAVLSNEDVKKAMNNESASRKQVHKQLQLLGHALQSMQSQRDKDKQGLDKVRAFMGNQQLVEEVHRFFECVLQLLGKKVLILPIDDVDTSLNRAFENLEVVRRYLTSPLVLPIISGDAGLYQEVTWRAFLHRLTAESDYDLPGAHRRAQVLAKDYQRKILPLQYRLRMPSVQTYLKNPNIVLGDAPNGRVPLEMFNAWLQTLLNDRGNGAEKSFLPVPVMTVRALGQLVSRVRDIVPTLEQALDAGVTAQTLRHAMLMPGVEVEDINLFRQQYLGLSLDLASPENERRFSRESAYEEFNKRIKEKKGPAAARETIAKLALQLTNEQSINSLCEYFSFDPDAGKTYLALRARLDWGTVGKDVFDTPLFQPLMQGDDADFGHFKREHGLSEWTERLEAKTSAGLMAQLPEKMILSYPAPERGMMVASPSMKMAKAAKASHYERLLFDLVAHRNFYSTNKTGAVICIGRIFEIVIDSLVQDASAKRIQRILNAAPFFSVSSFASTKTLQGDEEPDGGTDDGGQNEADSVTAIAELVDRINVWRKQHTMGELRLSPWMVYNVMNKVFNQAWYFNPASDAGTPMVEPFKRIAWIAKMAFNSIWAAFGSFEKGDLFGLPEVIATVNIGPGRDFQQSDLYRQNITPFVAAGGASEFGAAVRAITYFLDSHPLKVWMDDLPYPQELENKGAPAKSSKLKKVSPITAWLRKQIGRSTPRGIATVMRERGQKEAIALVEAFEKVFNDPRMRKHYNSVFDIKS